MREPKKTKKKYLTTTPIVIPVHPITPEFARVQDTPPPLDGVIVDIAIKGTPSSQFHPITTVFCFGFATV